MRPKKVILCVDQNGTTLGIRKFFLETRGYRVIGVVSVEQAIEAFRAQIPDIVVASFVLLPEMNGCDLVRQLKDIARFVPMIVTSPYAHAPAEHCADAFLGKSSDQTELLERIRILLIRKRGPKPHPQGSIVTASLEAWRTA